MKKSRISRRGFQHHGHHEEGRNRPGRPEEQPVFQHEAAEGRLDRRAEDRGQQVGGGEFARPAADLEVAAQPPQHQHVEEQVERAVVHERGGQQPPDLAAPEDFRAVADEEVGKARSPPPPPAG
jgi:hypothetical protein